MTEILQVKYEFVTVLSILTILRVITILTSLFLNNWEFSNIAMTTDKEKQKNMIFVNKKPISVDGDTLLGKEILNRAELDAGEYDLFLVQGQQSLKIEPEQQVKLEKDMRCNAILRDVPYGNGS